MPHLRYHGRPWRVSSDELFFPGIIAIFGRTFWSIVLVIILSYSSRRLSKCSNAGGLLTYLYLSLAVIVTSLFCEVCLVKKSLVGSMVETERREEGLEKYLTAHIVLGGMQFLLAIFGVFVVSQNSFIPCARTFQMSTTFDLILLSVIIISQLVDISSLVCCCYAFSSKSESSEIVDDDEIATSIYERRCKSLVHYIKIISCNIFGGSYTDTDLKAVAKVLTAFFHHTGFLDVVPSDVMAGIILVRIQQRAKRRKAASHLANGVGTEDSDQTAITFRENGRGPYSPTALSSPDIVRTQSEEIMDDIEVEQKNADPELPLALHSVSYSRTLDSSCKADRDAVEAAAKYAVYMIAMYTHLMVLYTRPCTGICCLCYSCMKILSSHKNSKKTTCSCNRGNDTQDTDDSRGNPVVRGDNFCGMNHAGLRHFSKHAESEVVYASYVNDTALKPFAIFLCEKDRTVIIAIRGSLSIDDCLTDAIADPVELADAGVRWGFDGRGRYAHTGFLKAALSIREELEECQVLNEIFRKANKEGRKQGTPSDTCQADDLVGTTDTDRDVELGAESENLSSSNYKLVVVGHSLGAAAAAILSLTLRNEYPEVICLGYGMPASVYDWRTAQDCCTYVTSVVLGTDMVARMSVHAMSALRAEMLDCIARAKVHKVQVLHGVFKNLEPDALMYPPGDEPESSFRTYLNVYQERMHERVIGSRGHFTTRLYLPGKALHFKKSSRGKRPGPCGPKTPFAAVYAPTTNFLDLNVSPTMTMDHLPDRYIDQITRVWDSWNQ